MKTIEKLIEKLDAAANNPANSHAVRNAAKQDAEGYRRVLKVRTEQKAKSDTQRIDQEMYETLVALQAETQGFLDQSEYLRGRALAAIARFEGR